MEKSIKALLAMEQIEVTTHNGGLKQFNYAFIYKGDGTFKPEDYQKIAGAEQIRNVSDYDDFYVASKDETRQLVENTKYIVNKIENYIVGRLDADEFLAGQGIERREISEDATEQ